MIFFLFLMNFHLQTDDDGCRWPGPPTNDLKLVVSPQRQVRDADLCHARLRLIDLHCKNKKRFLIASIKINWNEAISCSLLCVFSLTCGFLQVVIFIFAGSRLCVNRALLWSTLLFSFVMGMRRRRREFRFGN